MLKKYKYNLGKYYIFSNLFVIYYRVVIRLYILDYLYIFRRMSEECPKK